MASKLLASFVPGNATSSAPGCRSRPGRLHAGGGWAILMFVVRTAVVLAMLTGCNLVFGVDIVEVPAVCGPFGEPVPVVFDPRLEDPRELSVDESGTRGMVFATYQGTPTVKKTRPHAIRLEGGMWVPDDARNTGLDSLYGGTLVTADTVLGWIDQSAISFPELAEYRFITNNNVGIWNLQNDRIDNDTSTNKRAGNMILINLGAGNLRLAVETRIALDGSKKTLQIRSQVSSGSWGPTDRLDDLALTGNELDPSSGVLTGNGDRFVYAAVVGDDPISHLYASEVEDDNTSFEPGERLQIPGNSNDLNITEPWINADCTVIYFSRDGVILTAAALDDPGSGQ